MRSVAWKAALLALWPALWPAGAAYAGLLGAVRAPASYRSWTVKTPGNGKVTLSQIHLPLTATIRLGTHADFVLSGAAGLASVEPDSGAALSLNGPSDVIGQLFVRFAGDRLLLQAGVNAPTGKRELDAEELAVARALGHPLLGFRLKQYGQGLDLNGGAALAFPLGGAAAFGLGGGFTHHGAYALTTAGADYDPASEFCATAGLDLGGRDGTRGGAALRLDATRRMFGKDRLGSRDIFEEGDQTELEAEGSVGSSGARLFATARTIIKSDNSVFPDGLGAVEAIKMRSGSSIQLCLGFDFPLSGSVRWGLDGEWSRFSGSDRPAGDAVEMSGYDGTAAGAGPTLSAALGKGGSLQLGGRILSGTLPGADGAADSDLSGFFLTMALRWRAEP